MPAILTVFGTRPEVIKLAPVIHALGRRSDRARSIVVSTSQHADLLVPLIRQFGLRIDHDLQAMVAGQKPADVLSRCLHGLGAILARERPDAVVVQGDTTTALAGALAAFYAGIPVAHVEAGLRTGDARSPFPEEGHRSLIARVTRWHFAATQGNARTLRDEGIDPASIFVVGNPVVDAVGTIIGESTASDAVRALLSGSAARRRIVLTTHRRENFGAVMAGHLATIRRFVDRHADVELIFPVHPNPSVRAAVAEHLPPGPRIRLVDPLDYADFVHLLREAWLLVSDSGGIQEEAPTVGKPLIVLRDTTERPEAVDCGIARLAGHDAARLDALLETAHADPAWSRQAQAVTNPFGDGRAGDRIASFLVRQVRTAASRSPSVAMPPVESAVTRGIPPAPAASPVTRRPAVTVVLPAFNEERDLPKLLPRIKAALERLCDYRILVVDDGSKDATAAIVTALSRTMPITLIRHPYNQGLGAAIRTGLKAAAELDGVVVTLDADNSQDPALIPTLIEEIRRGADVAIASRYQPGAAEIGVPRHRLLLSHGASAMLKILIRYPGVRDYSCGFRAYRVQTLRQLIATYGENFLRETGFSCMLELLINLRRIDARVSEVPLVLRYDLKEGASKMRIGRTLYRYFVAVARGHRPLPRAAEHPADQHLRESALWGVGPVTGFGDSAIHPVPAHGA